MALEPLDLSLRGIWKKVSARSDKNPNVRVKKRSYYMITDPVASKQAHNWLATRYYAEEEIAKALKWVSPMLGGETPFYKVDQDGYVEAINFRYGMGFTHSGWTGEGPTSNWLRPDDSEHGIEIKKRLHALTPLPSYDDINKLIEWPINQLDEMKQSSSRRDVHDFVENAKRQTNVFRDYDGNIYISVPFPDSFHGIKEMEDILWSWEPPKSLEKINDIDGRRIEKLYNLAISPLGKTISSGLNLFQKLKR